MESRITLFGVESLTDLQNAEHLGDAVFKRERVGSNKMLIEFPNEKHELTMDGRIPCFLSPRFEIYRDIREGMLDFLEFANQYLQQRDLYLCESIFCQTFHQWHSDSPERLYGLLYKIKGEQK